MIKATYKMNMNLNFIADAIKAEEEKRNSDLAPTKVKIVTDEPKNSTE
jgi:hypothetical protein